MESLLAEVRYREHRAQVAWVDENDWKVEQPARRHPVRRALARALLALADALAPAVTRETART
jgi:hypothetical protein